MNGKKWLTMDDFDLKFLESAEEELIAIRDDPSKKSVFKAVRKSLSLMRKNVRNPSLNAHKYDEIVGPKGEEVFESYAQNNTPGAYRIFWYYGPSRGIITIVAITPHP